MAAEYSTYRSECVYRKTVRAGIIEPRAPKRTSKKKPHKTHWFIVKILAPWSPGQERDYSQPFRFCVLAEYVTEQAARRAFTNSIWHKAYGKTHSFYIVDRDTYERVYKELRF